MAKFELKKNTVDLEFEHATFGVQMTDELMGAFPQACADYLQSIQGIDEESGETYTTLSVVTRTFIDSLLGDGAFAKISGGEAVNAYDAVEICEFIMTEIATYMNTRNKSLEALADTANHPALKQ